MFSSTNLELRGAGTGVLAGVFSGVSETGEIRLEIENWDCSRDIFVDVGRGRTGRTWIGVTAAVAAGIDSADCTALAGDSLVSSFPFFNNANRSKYWKIWVNLLSGCLYNGKHYWYIDFFEFSGKGHSNRLAIKIRSVRKRYWYVLIQNLFSISNIEKLFYDSRKIVSPVQVHIPKG